MGGSPLRSSERKGWVLCISRALGVSKTELSFVLKFVQVKQLLSIRTGTDVSASKTQALKRSSRDQQTSQ